MRNENMSKIDKLFEDQEFVYAIPHTDNHCANFYGDTYVCELSKSDVVSCVDCARDQGWSAVEDDGEYRDMTEDEIVDIILDDLQLDKPEE